MKSKIAPRLACSNASDPENPDDRAMTAVAAGDTVAFQTIFDKWKLPVINFLYRSLGCHADAEDVALEVFAEIWRAAPRYKSQGTFSAWLFAITRGKMLHELRRRRRKPVSSAPLELLESPQEDARAASERNEIEETLLAGLQELPETQRSALLLTTQTPMKPEEIASSIGVKTSNLYVLIHRARVRLKQIMEKNQ